MCFTIKVRKPPYSILEKKFRIHYNFSKCGLAEDEEPVNADINMNEQYSPEPNTLQFFHVLYHGFSNSRVHQTNMRTC